MKARRQRVGLSIAVRIQLQYSFLYVYYMFCDQKSIARPAQIKRNHQTFDTYLSLLYFCLWMSAISQTWPSMSKSAQKRQLLLGTVVDEVMFLEVLKICLCLKAAKSLKIFHICFIFQSKSHNKLEKGHKNLNCFKSLDGFFIG